MTDLSALSDADLLAATEPLETDTATKMMPCCVCGELVEVEKRIRKVRCETCRRLGLTSRTVHPKGRIAGVHQCRIVGMVTK